MLIGLHGKKQAGKDTVYGRTAHLMDGVLPVERLSFADMLYESAAAALGVTVGDLQDWKTNTGFTLSVTAPNGRTRRSLDFREYLQRYGTEAHRAIFGDNFWVEQVRERLARHHGRIVMVTDVRFPNEAEAVLAAGGRVVHVLGPAEVEHSGDGHASEEPLPRYLIDRHLSNARRDDNFASLDGRLHELLRGFLREEA